MKKVIFILAIIGLVFSTSSCGNKKKKAEGDTHTHSDGTVHHNDAHSQDAKPSQETFEVKTDDDAEHKHAEEHENEAGHDHDSEHTHEDGSTHTDHK